MQISNTYIVITLLASIGLTFIITQSFLFKGIRKRVCEANRTLGKMISCSQCFSFWSGIFNILGLLFIPYFIVFQIACISSILSYATWLILKGFMLKHDPTDEDEEKNATDN